MLPIWIAASIGIPFGTFALMVVDPTILRWFMALLVLSMLGVLMSGWRYRGRPRLPVTLGVGLFSGFGGGAVQIAGPAVIIYWLGGDNPAARVRANLLVYFLLTDAMLCVSYFVQDLFTAELRGSGAVAWRSLFHRDGSRRLLLPRSLGPHLSPRRLSDHRRGGAFEPAGTRSMAAMSGYALSFATSASEISKLA